LQEFVSLVSSDPRCTPSEVAELDAEMASLTSKLTDLTILRTKLLAARALINKVPPELLSRVFELAVHTSPSLLSTLSLVSKSWYTIVLSTPCLHTYVRLDETWSYHGGGDDARTTTESFLDRTKLQLKRSHDSKLLIDIDFRYLDGMADVHTIMKELQAHLHRCFYFKASTPDWDWLGAVREHSGSLGPALEELYLHIDSSESEDQTPVTFLSQPCPRLNTIVLERTPLTSIRPQPPTPPTTAPSLPTTDPPTEESSTVESLHPSLKQLQLIRDTRQGGSPSAPRIVIPLSTLLSTLSSTPTLTSLYIQSAAFMLNGNEDIFLPQPPKIPMPNLDLLTFSFVDSTNVGLFLENVDCKSLKTLRVQMDGAGSGEDSLTFLSKICAPSLGRWTLLYPAATIPHQPLYPQAPFPSLRHLDLRAISTSGPSLYTFIRALHGLSQLTALAISSPPSGCFGARLWELLSQPSKTTEPSSALTTEHALSQRPKQEWILPALTALIVQNARDVSGHEILRVVRARKLGAMTSRMQGSNGHHSFPFPSLNGDLAMDVLRPEPTALTSEVELEVTEITYLKIAGCYALDREGEVVDDLKRLVPRLLL
jgi:hypothetical protein